MSVNRKTILNAFLIASVCVLIDQLSKNFVKSYLLKNDSVIRIFDGLNIVYVEKKGETNVIDKQNVLIIFF